MSQAKNIIHEYPVQTVLTSSPQSTVYRSEDPKTRRQVVVKLLTALGSDEGEAVRERYQRAMGAVQFLRLTAFPEVLDFGFTDDNSGFAVMEWIDGVDLGTLAGTAPERTMPLLLQVVEALEALAMGEVHHLNLTPDNILVAKAREGETAKIVGLGTAVYDPATAESATVDEPADADQYVAPERRSLERDTTLDESLADLYSLALIISEVLGAQVKGIGSDNPEVRFSPGLRRELDSSAKLESFLNTALRSDPQERAISYPELKQALLEAMHGEVAQPLSARAAPPTAGTPIAVDEEEELNYETREILPDELPPEDNEDELPEKPPAPSPPPLPGAQPGAAAVQSPVDEGEPPPPLPDADFPPDPAPDGGPPPLPGEDLDAQAPIEHAEDASYMQATLVGSPMPSMESSPPPAVPDDDEEQSAPEATVLAQPLPSAEELTPPPPPDEEAFSSLDATVIDQPLPTAEELTSAAADEEEAEPYAADATVIAQPIFAEDLVPPSDPPDEPADQDEPADTVTATDEGIEQVTEALPTPEADLEEAPHLAATVLDQKLPSMASISARELESESDLDDPKEDAPGAAEADATVALPQPLPTSEESTAEIDPAGLQDPLDSAAGAGPAEAALTAPPPPSMPPTGPEVPPPTPPPSVQAVPAQPEAPAAAPPPAEAAAAGSRGKLFLMVGLAAVAVVVIAGLAIALLWWARSRPEAVAPTPVPVVEVATPVPPTPVPTPVEPEEPAVSPILEQADTLLYDGDLEGAREIVATLTADEIAAFSEEEAEIHQSLVQALEGSALDGAIGDLVGGLEHGSIRMLKRAVAGLDRFDESEFADRPGIPAKLDKAREALRQHQLLWSAHSDGDPAVILERCAAMIGVLPGYSTPYKFREEAAAALEAQAETKVRADDLDGALALLAPIQKYWPNRQGLATRVAQINDTKQGLASQQATISRALGLGQEGNPKAGLTILDGFTPIPKVAQAYSEARKQLAEQYAALDAQPPQVSLAPGVELVFKKKKVATVSLVITDDLRVTGTAAFIRTEGASEFRMVPLKAGPGADQYRLELTPEMHLNDDVGFYIEAIDESGHTGSLGSATEPLTLKRKRLFGR